MPGNPYPILYSFRRCPYAMRARMALYISNRTCTLREVVLRDKPTEMLAASPKGTVPVLVLPDGRVLEQSLDIMLWTLEQDDPAGWLSPSTGNKEEMLDLIQRTETEFKPHLDRYKYATRYDDADPLEHRQLAGAFITLLNERLSASSYLFGERATLADVAIAPFIRQFANADRAWFDAAPYPFVQSWLGEFVVSDIFLAIMNKYKPWKLDDEPVHTVTASP